MTDHLFSFIDDKQAQLRDQYSVFLRLLLSKGIVLWCQALQLQWIVVDIEQIVLSTLFALFCVQLVSPE